MYAIQKERGDFILEFTIVNLFDAIMEYFALYAFLWIFFENNAAHKKWLLLCHVLLPVFFLLLTSANNIYLRPPLFLLGGWLLAFHFQGSFGQRIFFASIFQMVAICLEIVMSLFFYPLHNSSPETFYLAADISLRLGILLIVFLLFFASRKKQIIFSKLNSRYVLILIAFSAMSLFFVLFTEYLLLLLNRPTLYGLGCIGILVCIFVNIGLYYIFYQLASGEAAKAQLKILALHLAQQKDNQQSMEQADREIRTLSHDMHHYLTAILSLLEANQIAQAKKELQRKQKDITDKQFFDTGYPVLNAMLTGKIHAAHQHNIQVQLFWNVTKPLRINMTDLAVILANSLDNAIEAAQQMPAGQAFLQIAAETTGQYLKLTLCNSSATAPVLKDGKLVTTKKDTHLHGLGLESIKILAQQYEGDMRIDYAEQFFTLTILLKNVYIEN